MLKKLLSFFLVCSFLLIGSMAQAVSGLPDGNNTLPADNPSSNYQLDNPLGNDSSTVQVVIENIIKALLGLVGVIALIMFILGGFKVMTAAGDGKKVHTGFHTMLWAAIGLILIFASRILLNTVLGAF